MPEVDEGLEEGSGAQGARWIAHGPSLPRKIAAMNGVSGIVLAGGLGRRMGGVDKGLQPLRGKPMVEHVLALLSPQVNEIILNAKQNAAIYPRFCQRPVADGISGFAGPL